MPNTLARRAQVDRPASPARCLALHGSSRVARDVRSLLRCQHSAGRGGHRKACRRTSGRTCCTPPPPEFLRSMAGTPSSMTGSTSPAVSMQRTSWATGARSRWSRLPPGIRTSSSSARRRIRRIGRRSSMIRAGATSEAVKNGKVFVNPSGAYLWDRHSAEAALQVLWAAKRCIPRSICGSRRRQGDQELLCADFSTTSLTDAEFRRS